MKRLLAVTLSMVLMGSAVTPLELLAAEPFQQKTSQTLPVSNDAAADQNEQAVQNQNFLLQSRSEYSLQQAALMSATDLKQAATLEANYITAAQFKSTGHAANGAINNVLGAPTWVVPRENALAILGLIESAEITGNAAYLNTAALAIGYLSRVQDTDGAWFDQYDHQNVVVRSKSPTQTAEVMIAYYKFGYDAALYASMKKAAQYLLACQNVANKKGNNDGLLGGGKDANGVFYTTRWASDNAFAYQAFKAAQAWAAANGDTAFATQMNTAATQVLNGINNYLYNSNPSDDDYGVWKRAINQSGVELEPNYHEWINYAPQMLDLPAIGVGADRVGDWIHNKFQQADGSVVWDDGPHNTRKSPGFSFQASLAWLDIGQTAYSDTATNWAINSGLWQKTSSGGAAGGWIDWKEPSTQAPSWQRFIDTSFYSIVAFKGGYDFNIETSTNPDILAMRLQDNDTARADFNLLYGTKLAANGNILAADKTILQQVANDPSYNYTTFLTALTKTAALQRSLQANPSQRTDFNLLYGAGIPSTGAPNATHRATLFGVTGAAGYVQTTYLASLTKTAALFRAIQPSTANRNDFNLLYGSTIPATGAPNATDRGTLFGVTGATGYNQTTYLASLTKTAALQRSLQANPSQRTDFNLLYAAGIPSSGAPSATHRATLFGVTGVTGYNQTTFLASLTKAAALYRAIQPSTANRNDFNLLYGSTLAATGSPNATDRTTLFGVVDTSGYNQAHYLASLTKTAALQRSLQANPSQRTDFNLLYAAGIPASGAPSAAHRATLFGVTGASGYNQTQYLAALTKTAALYRAIQPSSANRSDFNLLYGSVIAATGSPNATDRTTLFGITGGSGYNQTTFLSVLTKTAALYRAIQPSTANRNDFNLLYGSTIAATGTPNATDRTTLFGVAGASGYSQTSYLSVLTKTASLYRAVQASSTYRTDFNLLYAAKLAATGAPNATDRGTLFGVAGDPNFNQSKYLPILRNSSSLYTRLQGNTTKRNSFNSKYAAQVKATGSPSAQDRTKIFGITGTSGYNENAFWATL